MVNSDPKWKQFEKLGEKIFKELSPIADVKWNDHVKGHDSGTKRQIDISIRTQIDNHEIFQIIQLKNWKYKANITAIDEFASVVKDVNATSGILVCKSGFTSQAKKYAKNIGIKLCNLHDAESREWNQDIKIPILWIEYTLSFDGSKGKIFNKYEGTINFGKRSKFTLSPDGGKSFIDLLPLFKEKWNTWQIDKTPNKEHRFPLPEQLQVRTILKDGREIWQPFEDFQFIYKIKRKKSLFGYFKPKECRGIIDYHNDDAFIASHLPPLDQLPTTPKEGWREIENPEKLAITINSSILTVEKFDRIDSIEVQKMMFIEEETGKKIEI